MKVLSHTEIHSQLISVQCLGLPLSLVLDPGGLSGTVRWSKLLFNEEVSSLDKEFKNPLSAVTRLVSVAWWLFASEGTGEWTCTENIRDCPTASAAELLTIAIQDCLSLGKLEDDVLGVATAFSKEEEECDVSLSLGEDEDAFCAT